MSKVPEQDQTKSIAKDWVVAIALREPVGDLACYVGEVQAIDDRGVRVTLIDWLIGMAVSWDFFVPWSNIAGMQVATQDHGTDRYNEFGKFQTRCGHQHGLMTDEEFEEALRRQ